MRKTTSNQKTYEDKRKHRTSPPLLITRQLNRRKIDKKLPKNRQIIAVFKQLFVAKLLSRSIHREAFIASKTSFYRE